MWGHAAYFPVLKYAWSERKLASVKQAKEELFHLSVAATFGYKFVQAQYTGIKVRTFSGKQYHGLPIVGLWVGDTPERHIVSLVNGSEDPASGERRETWNRLDQPFTIRSLAAAKQVYMQAEQHFKHGRHREMILLLKNNGFTCNSIISRPLRPLLNACFSFRFFSPYVGMPPEEMHDFAGLLLMLLACMKDLIANAYSGAEYWEVLRYIDTHYKEMPLFTGLSKFNNGIMHLKLFTAAKLRCLLKTCVCVFAEVFDDDGHTQLFVAYLEVFTLWKAKEHTDKSLMDLDAAILCFLQHVMSLLADPDAPVQKSLFKTQKYQSLKKLSWYGKRVDVSASWSANVLKNLHKQAVKDPFQKTMGVGVGK